MEWSRFNSCWSILCYLFKCTA